MTREIKMLPRTIEEAKEAASNSEFIRDKLPASLIEAYCD